MKTIKEKFAIHNVQNCEIKQNSIEQVFEIVVTATKELTNDEMMLVAQNFVSRLQGYTTECPRELKGAKIELRPKLS